MQYSWGSAGKCGYLAEKRVSLELETEWEVVWMTDGEQVGRAEMVGTGLRAKRKARHSQG